MTRNKGKGINKLAMAMTQRAIETLPVKHRAGEWISKLHVERLLYGIFADIYVEAGEEE
tara:strand:- start:134 stop:310 length:177 start_codon:yes stop_codon:yes gene_type:complete